nr:78_t:CDS:2 [Entrophospora candida]
MSFDEAHSIEDHRRLGCYCKDSWDYIYNYINYQNLTDRVILNTLNKLKFYGLHIHGTTMDVYVLERKIPPLFVMNQILQIELLIVRSEITGENFVNCFKKLNILESLRNFKLFERALIEKNDNGDRNSDNSDDKENGDDIDEIERLIKTFNTPLKKMPILYGFYNNNTHN